MNLNVHKSARLSILHAHLLRLIGFSIQNRAAVMHAAYRDNCLLCTKRHSWCVCGRGSTTIDTHEAIYLFACLFPRGSGLFVFIQVTFPPSFVSCLCCISSFPSNSRKNISEKRVGRCVNERKTATLRGKFFCNKETASE